MRIGIVAGEVSGDLLGAQLIGAIKALVPNAVIEGVAGPRMMAQGCQALFPMEKLAVMGLVEVLGHYRELRAIRWQLLQYFLTNPPDVFIGIDAPDFNLGLERKLKQAGIPTVHYVSPSVWAWRQYRVKKISQSMDLMLTLFPFEAAFYEAQRDYHVPVSFVGHPLADIIGLEEGADSNRARQRQALGLPATAEVIALLPGSRASELRYLADTFVQAAVWCRERRPNLHFVAPLANQTTRSLFEQALARYGPDLPILMLDGRSHEAMLAADAVLVASGTATLEALLLKRPMVVAYRMAWLTAKIARWLIKTPYYSLPNLLAGRPLVEEFSQEAVTAENLGRALLRFLEQPARTQMLGKVFTEIHQTLRKGASQAAAQAIVELVATRTKQRQCPCE
ncbi:MAG TPA: lipid-A-disaccharide synthase [Gammaproteobacteria bacterium]|nr:lipid-A-disaccharide synthase [Gammaproteobacteria bacterium]